MMSVVIGDIIGDDGVIGNDGNNHTGALLIQKSHFVSFKGVVFFTPGRPLQESHFDFFWVDTCGESF